MTVPVRVAIDFTCPASYLAIGPTRELEARLGAAFEWLPFPSVTSTQPRVVVSGGERSARHFQARAGYLEADLRRYAESRGIDLGELPRNVDSTVAAIGLLWLRRHAPAAAGAYVEGVFDRIWRERAEPDAGFVADLIGVGTKEFADFANGDGPADRRAVEELMSSAGAWNVPAYLVGGELFIGRQHLPAVEMLASRPELSA